MARRPGGARAADGSGARKEMTEENDLKDGSGAQPGNRRPDERARRRARPQRVFDTSVPSPCIAVCQVDPRSEEHTSELQSLMRISYAVFCLKKKTTILTTRANKETQTTLKQTLNKR